MKTITLALLFIVTVSCVGKKKEESPISPNTDVSACTSNSNVIDQSNYSGSTVIVATAPGNEIVQSFKLNCKNGIVTSISIRLNCYNTGFTCSARLGLYEGGEAENLNSLIEEVDFNSIADSPAQYYTATFTSNIILLANHTYWIKLSNTGAKTVSVYNSGATDSFSNGDLWSYYMSGLTVQAGHKDLSFKVKLY